MADKLCSCGLKPLKLFSGPGWKMFGCQRCNIFGIEPTWKDARASFAEAAEKWTGRVGVARSYKDTEAPGYTAQAIEQVMAFRDGRPGSVKQEVQTVHWAPVEVKRG